MASFTRLTKRDFTQRVNINNPATLSPILDVAVPRGQVWLLGHNDPMEMTVITQELFAGADAPNAAAFQFQLNNEITDIPHLIDSQVVAVFDTVTGAYLTIDSVDYENDTVTVDDATPGNDCIVFYPFKRGNIRIAIQAPVGMGSLMLPIFSRGLNGIHTVDQYQTTSPLKLRDNTNFGGNFGGWVVPETYRLQVLLNSAIPATTHPAARNYHISIPYKHAPQGAFPADLSQRVKALMSSGGR